MSYRIYRFGGSLLLPEFNPVHDIGTGKVRLETIDAPRGGAFDALGKEKAFRGGYALDVSGVLAGSDLQTQFDALRSCLGKRDKLWRIDDAGAMQWAWARLEEAKSVRKSENINYLDVDVSFFVYSALWNGKRHGSWRLDDGNAIDNSLLLDDAYVELLASESNELTLVNDGNGTIRTVEFAITPKGSAISSVSIIKQGETAINWSGLVAVDTQLAFNFGALSVTNGGVNAYDGLSLGSGHVIDDWLRMDPGSNAITVTRTGGGAASELAITFYDGWV